MGLKNKCPAALRRLLLNAMISQGLSSVEEDDSRDQLNCGEKICRQLVVSGRDGAKVLHLVEEALDEIALAVKREIAVPLGLAVGFWRDDRRYFPLREAIDEQISIVGLVCDQGVRIGVFNQVLGASQIVDLPCREHQVGGIAQGVDESMDFRGQSAARSTDRLVAVFF